MNVKTIFLLLAFSLLFNLSQSQENSSFKKEKISIKDLIEDLNILKTNLEVIHAGLYNYTSKEEMDKLFKKIKSKIIKPLSPIEFYRLLVPLHKYIKNGHTIIIPSEEFDNATATTTPVLPIDVYWDKNSLYVLRNNSDNISFPIGVKINSINGYNASKLFLKMSNLWTRDGNNTTFPEGITQRAFAGFYINLIGSPEFYNITYTDSLGELKSLKLKALLSPKVNENRTMRYGDIHGYWQKGDGDAVTLNFKDKTAILSIKTCSNSDIRKFGKSIKGILNRFFKEISNKGIEHLIIDLRDNGGGDEIISRELFRHISPKPFILFDDSYLITNKIPNKKLYKENINLMNTFAKIGLHKGEDSYYRQNWLGNLIFRSNPKFKKHKPYKRRYTGKLYTLTNAYTFSAAGEIASSMKTNTNSLFIGEEPGGNATQIVAGMNFILVLPNSKNRIIIPVVNQLVHTNVTPNDRGVIPDFKIRNSIEDMINKKDAALEFTFQLIRKSN